MKLTIFEVLSLIFMLLSTRKNSLGFGILQSTILYLNKIEIYPWRAMALN